MALLAIEGIYADGRIDLVEHPKGLTRARVVVTFLPADTTSESPEGSVEAARRRAFARMAEGIDLGGGKFNREDLYAERMDELEQRRRP